MAEERMILLTDMTFEDACATLRGELKVVAGNIKFIRERHGAVMNVSDNSVYAGLNAKVLDRAEMIANLMLAYRHAEDAIMRLGKAIQAFDGGASVYPR